MFFIYLTLIISFLLDGVLSNYLDYMLGDITLFNPLLTIVALLVIYPFFKKDENKYLIIAFIVGFLYDLFYTNLLFTNAILFLLLAIIYKYLYKKLEVNILTTAFSICLIITIYEITLSFLLFIFNIVPITTSEVFYLIVHSLILNVIYGDILYLISRRTKRKRRLN